MMYLRVWWDAIISTTMFGEDTKEERSGIVIGPGGSKSMGLCVRSSNGSIVWVYEDIIKSEWVTDPSAGVSSTPPRGQ